MPTKVVLDTNVIISAVGWKGNARRVLDLCVGGDLLLLESPEMLREIENVLRRPKFDFIPREKKRELLKHLSSISEVVRPTEKPRVIWEDPSDDKFL